jgi:VWFA-related protein
MNSPWLLAAATAGMMLISPSCLLAQQTDPSKADQPQAPGKDVAIRVAVNSVLVPVVVRDSQGRVTGDLKQDDFRVFDNNKDHVISGFSIQRRASEESASGVAPARNSAPVAPVAIPPANGNPNRFVIFLFDDMHLAANDLQRVQQVATKMVAASLGNSDAAAILSFSGTNSGLTRDPAKLNETIAKLRMQNLYRREGHDCPDVDYYQADLIENKHDIPALDAAVEDAMTCAHLDTRGPAEDLATSAARRALSLGDQDVLVSLGFVRNVVQRMESLPGQRTLILISPGFLTITPDAMFQKSQILDMAARSNVTISAMDARGLYTSETDASEHGANTATSLRTGQWAQNHRNSMSLNEDVMAELADGTGGTYFHSTNDLQGGFQKLTAAPEYVYLLEISLDKVKMDGSYHRLQVKLSKDGLKLQARHGYFAPKKTKEKK